jgi:hypothetical protein
MAAATNYSLACYQQQLAEHYQLKMVSLTESHLNLNPHAWLWWCLFLCVLQALMSHHAQCASSPNMQLYVSNCRALSRAEHKGTGC